MKMMQLEKEKNKFYLELNERGTIKIEKLYIKAHVLIFKCIMQNERNAREEMKQEQDAAYHESLAADRAKVEAEKMRQNEEIEKQRKEKLEEELKEVIFYRKYLSWFVSIFIYVWLPFDRFFSHHGGN